MRKLLALLAALALVVGLTACGASAGSDAVGDGPTTTAAPDDDDPTTTAPDDDDDDDDPTTTTEGGGDPDPDAAVYTEALVTGMSSGDPGEDLVLTREEARCVAPVWVDAIGLDALSAIDPQELADPDLDLADDLALDEEQAATMIAGYADCDIDIQEKFASYLVLSLPAEQARCVAAQLADVDLLGLLESALVDEDAAEAEFTSTLQPIFTGCGVE